MIVLCPMPRKEKNSYLHANKSRTLLFVIPSFDKQSQKATPPDSTNASTRIQQQKQRKKHNDISYHHELITVIVIVIVIIIVILFVIVDVVILRLRLIVLKHGSRRIARR
mmetsp:Transcript_2635/g.7231  ORF Transcript_2635/g.7231 Transcript_2635/m.7231 type:complete len:110 (-) Transcript_2635:213-542(-)